MTSIAALRFSGKGQKPLHSEALPKKITVLLNRHQITLATINNMSRISREIFVQQLEERGYTLKQDGRGWKIVPVQ